MSGGEKQIDLQGPATGLTPILVVQDAKAAAHFYRAAFGAREIARIATPDGKRLIHVRFEILGSKFIVMDELQEVIGFGSDCKAPANLHGTSVTLHLQVENGAKVWNAALAAGAHAVIPFAPQFWGELYGRLRDPFGHEWTVAQFVEHISDENITQAADAVFRS